MVKLKVRCQKCGKIGDIDTTRFPCSGWCWYEANDVLPDLAHYLGWEFWLCGECKSIKVEMDESGASPEEIEQFFKEILEPTEEELEGRKTKC